MSMRNLMVLLLVSNACLAGEGETGIELPDDYPTHAGAKAAATFEQNLAAATTISFDVTITSKSNSVDCTVPKDMLNDNKEFVTMHRVYLERPGRIAILYTGPHIGWTYVTDGETMYGDARPMEPKPVTMPLPDSKKNDLTKVRLWYGFAPPHDEPIALPVVRCMTGDDSEGGFAETYGMLPYKGEAVFDGRNCHVLDRSGITGGKQTWDIYIDKETNLVAGCLVEDKDDESGVDYSRTVISKWSIDAKLPDNAFQIPPVASENGQ
jgi:outer membrane lipoprotein-sorting protein